MKINQLTTENASSMALLTLGLEPSVNSLTSAVGIAATLRRAASFLCPTSPSRLVDAALGATKPLTEYELHRAEFNEILDRLIVAGDLLELRHESERLTRLLFLGPPSYIERVPGSYELIGIRPFGAPLLDDELSQATTHKEHTRIVNLDPSSSDHALSASGLQRVSKKRWVSSPNAESPTSYIDRFQSRLSTANEAGQIDELSILDPGKDVRYYKGRWREPRPADNGDYVARRPQAYGMDLWCLVRINHGDPQRLLDLPVTDPILPGRDEAWRYQAALDADGGFPQLFRLRNHEHLTTDHVIDFFSPLPTFAQRYMQLTGQATDRSKGALFSFKLPADAVDDAAKFLIDLLWMKQEDEDDVP